MRKHFLLFCGGILALTAGARAQNISTIAGNGTAGYVADGVAATSTQLSGPTGVAVDAAGNVYIADANNHRVRKVSTTGIISTIAGTGVAGFAGDGAAATAAQLSSPTGVAVDAAGNIYISDRGNQRVRKVNASGVINAWAGTGSLGSGGDGGIATAAQLSNPSGIYLDNIGRLYVGDVFNHKVRVISAGDTILTAAGTGTLGFSGDGGSPVIAKFNQPSGIGKDAAGNIYIADKVNNRIRRIDFVSSNTSTICGETIAGFTGDGGPATAAKLNAPTSVKVDATNNIYICDMSNNVIRKITPAGVISTIAGSGALGSSGDGGPATAAALNFPTDIAIDAVGNIYIADAGNNKIRKIKMSSASIRDIEEQGATLTLFPNPSAGSFTIELPNAASNVVLTIEDITGKIVETKTITTHESRISYTLARPVTGLYLVKAYTDAGVYCGKLEVQ